MSSAIAPPRTRMVRALHNAIDVALQEFSPEFVPLSSFREDALFLALLCW